MTETDQNVHELQSICDKEERIRQLSEEIEELQSKITELTLQLQSKDEEIEKLKEEVCKKKKEKENLKKSIKKHEYQTKQKDSQISKLDQSMKTARIDHDSEMKKVKEETSRREEKLKHSSRKIESLRKKLDEKTKDNLSLTKKLEEEKEENVSLTQQNNDLISEINSLKKEKNQDLISKSSENPLEKCYLYIGQLCAELQENMYHYVLPDEYAGDGWGYNVCDILRDIEKIKDHRKRKQARERLQDLEDQLKWEKHFEGVIEFLQRKRNQVAHPKIANAEAVREAVDVLNREGKLKGKVSYERVSKIIDMYEKSVPLIKRIAVGRN